jgi:hypothetical protein
MYTYHYNARGYDKVWVIVNSDWSGDAKIYWQKDKGGTIQESVLPGPVVFAIAKVLGRELMQEGLNRLIDSLEEGPS